ncbi:hypothetical protein CCACVL1_20188 [Corchorus capsularis]|uniref:RNase H type-1 domain-containing protein n=1 Tax=Corchorus capsularis TaxID=210143 RepID=A0A1R3HC70_COCAP|nr:hypothetical protein CCACVL1_20188 [Corchorus capsularis]
MVPFQSLLKKGVTFTWGDLQQKGFEKVKDILTAPATMTPPIKGQPMMLYLTSTNESVGGLLVQEVEGVEKLVYYISRCLHGSELNYSPMEKHCLSLVEVTRKLCHYLLAHKLIVVTRSDPIKYLLSKTVMAGRASRWYFMLGEFDISVMQPKAVKSQALSDLLAYFPSKSLHEEILSDDLPGEVHVEVCHIEPSCGEWQLFFDGSSTTSGGGAGIVLIPPEARCEHEEALSLAFKLDFPCTNNQPEYETLVLGLHTATIIGVEELCIIGDSNLVVKQTNGEFSLKEPMLAPYRDLVRSFLDKFQSVRCEHSRRSFNRYADALATLASKINMPNGE